MSGKGANSLRTIEAPGHEHLNHKEDKDCSDVVLDSHYAQVSTRTWYISQKH